MSLELLLKGRLIQMPRVRKSGVGADGRNKAIKRID
jgi:hypothetical protein